MKTFIHLFTSCLLVSLFTGCANFNTVYKPNTIGNMSPSLATSGLKISIEANEDAHAHGEKIGFSVLAKNVSDKTIFIPRDPQLLFCWVYPNGRRDNFVFDAEHERYFEQDELIQIKPGQAVKYKKVIDTYYFPKRGITEFYAYFDVPVNTNPTLRGVWSGRAESNRYGVLIDKASRIAKIDRDFVKVASSDS